MERTIFFHEDDYRQIELLPASAWAYCQQEMGAVEDFAAAHTVPGGYSDIYLRQSEPLLLTLALPFARLSEVVTPIWPAFDRVETGYGSYREDAQHTRAFGLNGNLALFCSVTEQETVEALWLALVIQNDEQLAEAEQVLLAMAALTPLLLADWNESICVPLGDKEAVRQYLQELLEQWQAWETSR